MQAYTTHLVSLREEDGRVLWPTRGQKGRKATPLAHTTQKEGQGPGVIVTHMHMQAASRMANKEILEV